MIDLLKKEQANDNNKLEYCNQKLDSMDAERKTLERSISNSEKTIADAQDALNSLTSDIQSLVAGIDALDKSVAEASDQRKNEHQNYETLMSQDTAATELIRLARNRLYKFYAPKMYVPPQQRELSAEDRIMVNIGGTAPPTPAPGGIAGTDITALVQISMRMHSNDANTDAPEAPGAYKKSEQSTGVVAMLDLLLQDLQKEMTVAKTEEAEAQTDYVQMLADSAAKRKADSKSLTEKSSAKADVEAALQVHSDEKASTTKQLMVVANILRSTHFECDWLLQYHSMRKDARDHEIASLVNARAVLSGADYSLLETHVRSQRVRSFLEARK